MSEIISTTITWTFLSFLPVIFANSLDQVQARLTSMDVIVSHIQGRLLARAVILINCVLFINGSSLMEEKSEVSFLIGQSLMFEPCQAQRFSEIFNIKIYYACDSNNDLQANITLKPNRRTPITTSYICKNGSWALSTQPYSNEPCVMVPNQEENITFYSCDFNNNVQALLTFTSNLTHSLISFKTCVNGVWIITNQPKSNAPESTITTASVFQGKSQQESSVTKAKPAVILLAVYIILCFI